MAKHPGVEAWKQRVKELREKEKRSYSSMRNHDFWLMNLGAVRARRCTCVDGPKYLDISDSGFMYCKLCRQNLDQRGKKNPDPLIFVPDVHD